MLKGFKYIADKDSNFSDIIQNLYNKIITIENKLTPGGIKKFKIEINNFIDSYSLDLDRFYKYVIKNIHYTSPFDGEIMFAELYYKAQIYFLYNEVFTYGRVDNLFRAQIIGLGLDVQNTLYALSNYRASAIFEVYKNIKKITVPDDFKSFLNKYRKNKVFSIKIKKIRNNIKKYFSRSLSLKEFYTLANQTRVIKFKKNKPIHIDKKIILLYNTIIEIQRKLFIIQNIYEKTVNLLLKRFKNLEEYSGTKSKTNLINLYLDKINELKEYTLTYPKVYYKNYIIDVERGKKYKLSKNSSKIVGEVISQKKFYRPLIEILETVGKLEELDILKKG